MTLISSTLLILAGFVPSQNTTLHAFEPLTVGTWLTVIEFPGQTEIVKSKYSKDRDGITGSAIAFSIGGPTIKVKSSFRQNGGGAVDLLQDHGETQWVGSAKLDGPKIIMNYGPKEQPQMIRDEMVFEGSDHAKGILYDSKGTKIGTYSMFKILEPATKINLKGFDPIELISGKEIEGDPKLTVSFGEWEYRFTSQKNLQTFRSDPERYAPQFGGACMSMGPLSGRGQTGLYHVYEGRIYQFASPGCKSSFLKEPQLMVEKLDPTFKSKNQGSAKVWLEKAASAHGITAKNPLTAISVMEVSKFDNGGEQKDYFAARVVRSNGQVAKWDIYNNIVFGAVSSPRASWQGRYNAPTAIVEQERKELVRRAYRDPLAMLMVRGNKGFVADALGVQEVEGLGRVEVVKTWYSGQTTLICLNPKSAEVVGAQYIGRSGTAIVPVTVKWSDFAEVRGIKTPGKLSIKSERATTWKDRVVSYKLNEDVSEAQFLHPRS